MKTLIKWALFAAVLTGVAQAQVPLIGSQVQITGTANLATQGAYLGWNRGSLGEMDFENVPGAGTGGFCWYNTTSHTQLMCLSNTGALTTTTVNANLNGVIGVNIPAAATVTQLYVTSTPSTLPSQGTYLGWNKATLGETDFFTAPGSGVGGFNWYNSTSFSLQMHLDGSTGKLTNSNGFVGPLTGNADTATTAATASALVGTPSQCTNGATGIAANGNAICVAAANRVQSMFIASNICTTAGSELYCTSPTGGGFYNWPTAFASSTYNATCTFVGRPTGSGSNPGLYGPYIVGQTNAGIQITIQSGSNSAGGNNTVGGFYCIAQGA